MGPEAFVIPTGYQRKQHFILFDTCYLCSREAEGWEGGCHIRSLHRRLPSPTPPEGLILTLPALALSLPAKTLLMCHNLVLCSSLAGYFTKTHQGQGGPDSELATHQRGSAPLGQPLGNRPACPSPEAPRGGIWACRFCHVTSFFGVPLLNPRLTTQQQISYSIVLGI